MIITITGNLGSGKSTVAKLVAHKLSYKHYSTGDFMRQMAAERSVDLLTLNKLAEKDKSIDKELDKRQKNIGNEQDNFVIDARLGWRFIPHSAKIFLEVDDKEAARRIFSDQRKEEKKYGSLQEALENIKKRKESEVKRYKDLYNLDYYNRKNYDLVVDTTKISAEQVAQKIIDFVKKEVTTKKADVVN